MEIPVFYRKRIIPEECILLKDDIILSMDEDIIITKWETLKPRLDFKCGYSAYFLKEGYKVSKFIKPDGSLLYWYCDIIKYDYEETTNTYVFTDLLVDVLIYPDNHVEVVDIDEIAEALSEEKLSKEDTIRAMHSLSNLLKIIYGGDFVKYQKLIDSYS